MMETKRVSDDFHVCGQLTGGDVNAVKAAGFNSILCLRPDDEAKGQPSCASVVTAAEAIGLQTGYLPVPSTGFMFKDVARLQQLLSELPTPILAYCRSGARAERLFQAAH